MILRNPADEVRSIAEVKALLQRIPILTYHKVALRREMGINVVSPQRFRQHISFLYEEGFRSITFRDLLYEPELPPKTVILTFDDAYESIYQDAFPILQEFGFRGVVFVISGFIGCWNRWDINLGGIHFRHMTEEQLREIERAGWEIGSHGATHRALTKLNGTQLEQEVQTSRCTLEKISSKPLVSIAYPFGMHNPQVCRAAKEAGFRFGCKSIRGTNSTADLLQLRRIPVYQFEGVSALRRKLNSEGISLYEKIKLSLLSAPAVLTPFYQTLFKRQLLLEK